MNTAETLPWPIPTESDPRPIVLITADNEPCGRRALDHATKLFGPDHRYLVVGVHRHRHSRGEAEALATAVAQTAPGLAETLVLNGDPARAVCEAAHRCGAAAVIVGVDIESGDRTAPSHAFRILRRSPCPVVMVATSTAVTGAKEIVDD